MSEIKRQLDRSVCCQQVPGSGLDLQRSWTHQLKLLPQDNQTSFGPRSPSEQTQVIVPGVFRLILPPRADPETEILNRIVTWNDGQSGSPTATVTVKRQARRKSETEDRPHVDTDSSVRWRRDVLFDASFVSVPQRDVCSCWTAAAWSRTPMA